MNAQLNLWSDLPPVPVQAALTWADGALGRSASFGDGLFIISSQIDPAFSWLMYQPDRMVPIRYILAYSERGSLADLEQCAATFAAPAADSDNAVWNTALVRPMLAGRYLVRYAYHGAIRTNIIERSVYGQWVPADAEVLFESSAVVAWLPLDRWQANLVPDSPRRKQ